MCRRRRIFRPPQVVEQYQCHLDDYEDDAAQADARVEQAAAAAEASALEAGKLALSRAHADIAALINDVRALESELARTSNNRPRLWMSNSPKDVVPSSSPT